MNRFTSFCRRLRSLGQRRTVKQEIDEELRFHIEQRTAENIAAGISPEDAAREARKRFGNWQSVREECRDARGASFGEATWMDLKFACRQLRKNPGFTAVALLSLCLGIAANTTIFSFVNTLLLRPAPVEKPDSLWQVWRFQPDASSALKRYAIWSYPALAHLRDNNQSCSALGGVMVEPITLSWNRDGIGEPTQGLFVTGNFFDLAGVRPALGRFFERDEDQTPGSHPVVVVSQHFWKSRLGADTQAIGSTLSVNGIALTVIGVAPERFTGIFAGVSPDLWLPTMMRPAVMWDSDCLTSTSSHWLVGLARLKPETTTAQAGAELSALTQGFERSIGGNQLKDGAALLPSLVVPIPLRGYVQSFTEILMGAVLLVLLIACANAANLQFARAVNRRQEMAVRVALGAARGRLIRQLLTESVLLAALGGALGLLLSAWLARLIGLFIPASLPLRLSVEFDWRVLVFTASVSVLTGIVFGLAPALRGTRLNLAATLKDETRGLAVRRTRFANTLIIGQMALSLILLLAATLCLRSLTNARAFNPGFEAADRVAASFNLNDYGYTAAQSKAFQSQLLTQVQQLTGVQSAALTGYLPLGTEQHNGNVPVDGQQPPLGETGFFFERFSIGPGYFATMGTPLLQGREFTDADREGAPGVVIINEAAAKRYWPGQNPIGRRLGDAGNPLEIIGVVPTGRYRSLGEEPTLALFTCYIQEQPLNGTLVAHVRGASGPVLTTIRGVAQKLDSRLALTHVSTLEQHLSLALFPMRTSGLLLGVLGLVALILAVSGLFGVIAYSVSQRTREVGIRMALGAQRGDVLRLVLRQGLRLAGIGIVVGILGALALTQFLRSLLFGVSATDPLTFIVVPLLFLGVALLACWLPARRAAKVDPMVALRHE